VQLRRKRTLLHWSNIPDLYLHDQSAIFRFKYVIFSRFDFDLIAVIVMSFCVSMPYFTNIGSLTAEIRRLIDFQDGGRCGAILFPYRIGWRLIVQKINIGLSAYQISLE